MAVIGYARVSTTEQNTARQEEALNKYGVEKIFIDKLSGKDMNRDEFIKMMNYIRDGDIVVVSEMSRLSRNTKDLIDTVETLGKNNVDIVFLKESIDTKTASGKLLFHLMASIAEFERDIIKERQLEGIEIAKCNGKYTGRIPKQILDFESYIEKIKAKEMSVSSACKKMHISRSTYYRLTNKK